MPSTNYAYVNGHFTPEAEARVSIFDRGFLYGDGVFETMRVYGGRLFRGLDHMRRLWDGLEALHINSPFTPEELRAVCRALIGYNSVLFGVVRLYVTRDTVVATAHGRQVRQNPLRAIVSSYRLDPQLSRYKTANRLPYLLAQAEAERAGADEALLLNTTGNVAEFNTANIFVVKNAQLITPPLSDGPLPGITRQAVLALAAEARITVAERSVWPEFLRQADEVFATNSLIEILPVVSWGRPGPVTKQLQAAYRELVKTELV